MRRIAALPLTLLLLSTITAAQDGVAQGSAALPDASYQGRPRYPEGLLALRASYGITKYIGEFTDHTVGRSGNVSAIYSIFPELGIGLEAEFGRASYIRREMRDMTFTYHYQFGTENMVDRSTTYSSYHLELQFNFFPRQWLNSYFLLGAGATLFDPLDYEQEKTTYRPKGEHPATFSLPAGLGVDVFITRALAVSAQLRGVLLFRDDFDAFASGDIAAYYSQTVGAPMPEAVTAEGNDMYLGLGLGLRYFLFEDDDLDDDLLRNEEEEIIGTNPYDRDSDDDGLSDYEEVRVYNSDPRLKDTDADGLDDYVEVMKYRSDPRNPDSDGDGLRDGDEVTVRNTLPNDADTDDDGIPDGQEVRLSIDPRVVDTDRDFLSDSLEVLVYSTDPLVPDTDGDGLTDFEEVMSYGTDPHKPDTDGDGLTDFEEVATTKTSPLRADTDGDTLSDYDELRRIGTNPLRRDTDDDTFADNVDRCPLHAETFNGFQDADGCPDGQGAGAVAQAGPPAQPGEGGYRSRNSEESVSTVDTVVIREGGIITLFGVNFEVDKDIIRPESIPILEEDAKLFYDYPELIVEIRGHTDSDASDEYNMDLSLRRATAVRTFMLAKGVAGERMTVKAFGERMPVASNDTVFGKARNRRIEFYIVKKGERRK
jgi:outer membrane protein OmpA-like peptidoglycan-associated protein